MTTPGGDITLGEVMRRMDELGRRVAEAVHRIEETAKSAQEREVRFELRFLPRAEYELSQQADAIQLRGLEAEVHKVSKQQEACETARKDDNRMHENRWKEAEARARQNRTLVLSALVFPLLVGLIMAFLLAQGGVG